MSPCKVVDMTQVGFALASFPPVHRKRKEKKVIMIIIVIINKILDSKTFYICSFVG
jgi:hypothetical protein